MNDRIIVINEKAVKVWMAMRGISTYKRLLEIMGQDDDPDRLKRLKLARVVTATQKATLEEAKAIADALGVSIKDVTKEPLVRKRK